MPITFRASVYSYRTDREGAARLALDIPSSDRDEGAAVGQLTERVLLVTVIEALELQDPPSEGKQHES
jgi:hypothetical protein